MSAWGAPSASVGSWADDTEREMEESHAQPSKEDFPLPGAQPEEAFPTLGQAVKGGKKKKEKVTIPLSQFATGTYAAPAAASRSRSILDDNKGLTYDEMLALPTGPRARDESEEGGGLGGGFKDYGGYRGGRRDREGGFRDREDRGFRERPPREEEGPSRADEASDWGATKKFVPSGERGGRGGGFDRDSDRERGGPSRADETDDWGREKKFVPSGSSGSDRGGGFRDRYGDRDRRGGGFEDRERRSGFDDRDRQVRADDVDNWAAGKKFAPSDSAGGGSRRGGYESSRGGYDAPKADNRDYDRWGRKDAPPAEEAARPAGERPRLQLKPRSVPLEQAAAGGGAEGAAAAAGGEAKPKSKADPFGGARPREQVLAAKGVGAGGGEETSSVESSTASLQHLKLSSAPSSDAPKSPAQPPASSLTSAPPSSAPSAPKGSAWGAGKPAWATTAATSAPLSSASGPTAAPAAADPTAAPAAGAGSGPSEGASVAPAASAAEAPAMNGTGDRAAEKGPSEEGAAKASQAEGGAADAAAWPAAGDPVTGGSAAGVAAAGGGAAPVKPAWGRREDGQPVHRAW